jgi:integrase
MRGYTAKKGSRYYAVIYEGVDPATGKERRRWYPAGARKSDADRLVTELVKRRNDGDYRAPEKVAVGVYLTERWLPSQRSQLKASTFHSYRRTIELHVLPMLGNVPLARLAPEDLDTLYARLLESGRRNTSGNSPGLSPASVRYVHRILRKALGDAVRKGTLIRNPAALADPPKRGSSNTRGHEMRVWTAAQLQTFLASVGDERLGPALLLAAHTGMRRGEVAGLRWADVDLDANLIHVRQAATVVAYELHIADVKTSNGRRTIDINDDVALALHAWRRTQVEERLLVGAGYEDHDLVFARPDGRPTHPELLSRVFERVVVRIGLPSIRLHDLRHTHASLLLKAGVPVKVVSERLGHATPSFTLDVYGWVLPGMQAEAAAVFSRLMSADPVEDPVEGSLPERTATAVPTR